MTIRGEYVGLIVSVHLYVMSMQQLLESRQWAGVWSLNDAKAVRRAVSALPRRALASRCILSYCITVLSVFSFIYKC
jgi:hypothetical protein